LIEPVSAPAGYRAGMDKDAGNGCILVELGVLFFFFYQDAPVW
jgi:hypothetical protein